jgi:hypothetical protein
MSALKEPATNSLEVGGIPHVNRIFMSRIIHVFMLAIIAVSVPLRAGCQELKQSSHPEAGSGPTVVWGDEINGLRPGVFLERKGMDWSIAIEYSARINWGRNTWLLPTNRAISTLELWQTNGVPVVSKNPDVVAALHPAGETTVSNIINSVRPSNLRGHQWLRIPAGSVTGEAIFTLQWAFGRPCTNDCVLQITPFIYRSDTNLVNARLLEFPPIKVKLLSNGRVQKIEPPSSN